MQSPRDADRSSSASASSAPPVVNHEGKAAGMRQLTASVPIRTAASGAQIAIPILVVSITGDIAGLEGKPLREQVAGMLAAARAS